jgi:6-phosphogluconolactonase
MSIQLRRYADADALTASLATWVLAQLQQAIAERGRASLVVSGGRTPAALFARLASSDLAWDRVVVTLADERWVGEDHADSNARMVREKLLQDRAAAAHFVPLVNTADNPWDGLPGCCDRLTEIPRPFDVLLLGMGDDGHTASLFPDADRLPPPSAASSAQYVGIRPAHAPHDRISLSESMLRNARQIAVQIGGAGKWSVLCSALEAGPAGELPIRNVLHQDQVPCRVYWNP